MFDRLLKKIISKPKLVLIISVLLMIPSAVGFFLTGVNYNILSYLPDGLDSIQGEQLLDKNFGCASMSFLIVENMPTDDIKELTRQINNIDCVSSVLGVNEILTQGIPFEMFPDEIRNILYSSDGSSTIILIKFSTASADEETMDAINQINGITKKGCYLSGLSAILTDTKNLVEKQAPVYIIVAIFSALAMLAILSESWIMPPLVLYTLCSAVALNMGTNIIFGEISYLTECIAVVLQLAVTMDYSVFLVERYHEELMKGYSREKAVFNAVRQSFSSLVGSALTTVFGFAALCFMSLSLGLDIGLVMVKGVLFGLLSVFIVLPALLVLFDDINLNHTHKYLKPDFTKINVFLIKKRNIFSVVFVILLVPAFFLNSSTEEYYSLDEMLGSSRESIIALNKLKKDYNMASVDFAIVSDSIPDADMKTMLDELNDVQGISFVLSYSTIVGPAIPDEIIPDELLKVVKSNGKQLIIMISEYTAGHEESNTQINTLTSILKSY
ncbi:MAG: MMPL family transporter, partial [Clostridia bacterium]|nr:MMPL family transporter [Clostridia bacterium]